MHRRRPGHRDDHRARVIRLALHGRRRIVTGTRDRDEICDRNVVAHSAYMRDGDIAPDWAMSEAEDAGARAFLAELIGDVHVELPPAVVIDVGLLDSGSWAVVESNACWASGICACDAREVLRAVRRANVRDVRPEDARFVRGSAP